MNNKEDICLLDNITTHTTLKDKIFFLFGYERSQYRNNIDSTKLIEDFEKAILLKKIIKH